MKFTTTNASFILGQYVPASPQQPAVIELPDDVKTDHISRSWKPLDEKAVAALKSLGVKFPAGPDGKAQPNKDLVDDAPAGAALVQLKADEDAIQVTKTPTAKIGG